MHKNSRSLNLANSVAVILYGALNNIGFEDLGF
jgi:tRNA (cytidine/uridine-2'-O-)-methyltransferase